MLNDSETSHKKVIRLNANLACEMFRILNMTKCREKPLNLMTLGKFERVHLQSLCLRASLQKRFLLQSRLIAIKTQNQSNFHYECFRKYP